MVSWNYWEEDDYYVTDNPALPDSKTLYIQIDSGSGHGRVDCIDAIGSNDNYIIARSSDPKIEYWIIDKQKDNHLLNSFEIVDGPYSMVEFNNKKRELGIDDLKFSEEW